MAQLGISMIATSCREWIAYCRAAEAVDLAGAWTADSFARDSFVDAALALTHTTRLKVGLGVALPTRTPLQTARAAASLGEFGGRFSLGFGVGHSDKEGVKSQRFFDMAGAGAMESAHGIPFFPPVGRLKDFIDCVKTLIYSPNSETVDVERTHFRTRGKGFGYTPRTLPLVIGGIGPKVSELAGERANGLLVHHIAPRQLVAERVGIARAAHARSEGASTPFMTSFGLISSVDPDEGIALKRARAELAGALLLPEYLERLRLMDAAATERVDALLQAERYVEAAASLSEETVRDMILVSTPANFRRDAEAFPTVDMVLPLPAGIFGRMVGDALGIGPADWQASRDNLIKGVFGSALGLA